MSALQGYRTQQKSGQPQYQTLQQIGRAGGGSYASDTVQKVLFEASTVDDAVEADSTKSVINASAHEALPGDIIRFNPTSSNPSVEVGVISVTANTITLAGDLPILPVVGDLFKVMRWITPRADSTGSPIITSGPLTYKLDGTITEVSKDSITPANTIALPVEDFAARASLVSIDGKFTTLNAKDFATSAKQDTGNISLSSIDGKLTTLNAKDFATSVKQDTGNISLSSIDGKLTTLNAKDFATSAKQDTGNNSLSSIDGKLQENGVLSAGNSSTTPLGISGVFTGAAVEITKYACLNVNVISDVPSATDGVKVEFSTDGVTWDHSHSTSYTAASGVGYIFNAEFRYARVVYTNGAAAQTYFRLQTILKSVLVTSSLYTLSQSLNSNMFAQLNRSLITGETTGGGGGYVNVKVNPSGALTTESTVTGSVSVTNFPATQAVTGTFWQATQPVSAVSLPLPSGASTLAEQQAQSTTLSSIDSNTLATSLAVQTETSAFNTASAVVSGIDPTGSTVRALRVNTNNQLLTFIGNSSIVTEQSPQSGVITQTQKTVGVTAVRATVSGSAPLSSRKKLMLKPSKNNSGSVYFGSSAVTTASGMEIIGPDRLEFEFDSSDYYLISDTAGQVVEIVEIN
jgi:hypothetical protein